MLRALERINYLIRKNIRSRIRKTERFILSKDGRTKTRYHCSLRTQVSRSYR
ncbi:hypothetical protein LCDVSa131L [Lymphocystis disease virus 3]|uniref:Uncharacterized protein n=1 Tax=Lymphocystis disease virus 3 TaxID=2560566 RepID=A0A1B2RW44_9VIRU|nr:hypothetical protein BZK12_gp131 [Lymphocystis disease virus Sa]AOC55215.1 hypothetical protein LCDVSa131L [Lymphocystis disease virus 3]